MMGKQKYDPKLYLEHSFQVVPVQLPILRLVRVELLHNGPPQVRLGSQDVALPARVPQYLK